MSVSAHDMIMSLIHSVKVIVELDYGTTVCTHSFETRGSGFTVPFNYSSAVGRGYVIGDVLNSTAL